MKLVICEKNIAARRIAYILSGGKSKSKRLGSIPVYDFNKDSEEWRVIGLKGHIINLDYPAGFNKWNKIAPSDLIDVDPVKKVGEKSISSALKDLVKNAPFVIVATDFDREGELIGVEVVNLLKEYNKNIEDIKRAKFSAITGYEIKNAFEKLTEVDYNLSDAGESRQIIDLIWGAVLTRFISLTSHRYGRDFLSIGRVQSPTLAILVDREKEIIDFVPKKFWKIIAKLDKNKVFDATHVEGQFWDEKQVKSVFAKVKDAKSAKVTKLEKKQVKEYPPSPFNTTSFLQAASALRLSTSKAMSVAEELYMMGLISYPRTDNTVYPNSLNIKGILGKLKKSDFSKEVNEVINNGRSRPTRGKKMTTDHPPIHPVDVVNGKKLSKEQAKLYELIVRRFLATLAKDAVLETVDAWFDICGEKFHSNGVKTLESNWRSIYNYFRDKNKFIPVLSDGELVDVKNMNLKEDETKPPARYTQGSLIAKMEQLSLGTKSTRHEIINKLYRRRYIVLSPLKPNPIAFAVVDALSDYEIVKPKMTAKLEEDMDLIADGKKTLDFTVDESRKMLKKVMNDLVKDKEKIKKSITSANEAQNTVGPCPVCGKNLLIRRSKRGKRFVGCSGFPSCKNTYSLPQTGRIIVTDKLCKECSAPVVKVASKGKRAWELCLNSDCSNKKPTKKPEKKN